jgi:lipopolysaccharide transport system permease protein
MGGRQLGDLVRHLVRRQLDSQHRFTVLGWLWPLVRQGAQLAVLVFLFSKVLDLGIPDYPLFVFTGLLVWTWFQTGLTEATRSLETGRHLVFSPRFPDVALPLVAVAAPLVDLLMALPILLVLLIAEGHLGPTALLFPAVLAAVFAFTAGLGMLCAAANVFFRDVTNIVGLALLAAFYVTPVFYGLRNVPERFAWVLHANPMTAYVETARALLIEQQLPTVRDVAIGLAAAALALALGGRAFRRLQPRFVDEL